MWAFDLMFLLYQYQFRCVNKTPPIAPATHKHQHNIHRHITASTKRHSHNNICHSTRNITYLTTLSQPHQLNRFPSLADIVKNTATHTAHTIVLWHDTK